MNLAPELLIGMATLLFGAVGGWFIAPRTAAQTEHTKRIDILLDHQGQEIARLGSEVKSLRNEFKEEQQLTETLKEESSKWRGLLQVAVTYLRRLHIWQSEEQTCPPPAMPSELTHFLWEDL